MSLAQWLFGILCLAVGSSGLLALSQGWIKPGQFTAVQEKEDEPLL